MTAIDDDDIDLSDSTWSPDPHAPARWRLMPGEGVYKAFLDYFVSRLSEAAHVAETVARHQAIVAFAALAGHCNHMAQQLGTGSRPEQPPSDCIRDVLPIVLKAGEECILPRNP